jgi:uncharacterized membrane protein
MTSNTPAPRGAVRSNVAVMDTLLRSALVGALLSAPVTHAAECTAPPVRTAQQATCYAVAYADKNALPHGRSFARKVRRGKDRWTVAFANKQRGKRTDEWEVDVDAASGTVVRFSGHRRPPEERS